MSQHPLVQAVENEYLKADLPALFPGDTVKVMVRIKEGNKERLQAFEGIVIRKAHGGLSTTISVRKVFQGVGVERTFLIHSPKLESIQVLRRGRVRRAKLYYLRDLAGKAARIREKTTGYAAAGKFGSLITVGNANKRSNKKK